MSKEEKRVLMQPGKTNEEDRINFVRYWANFVRTHADEEWSEQQNVLIDSQYPQLDLFFHPIKRKV